MAAYFRRLREDRINETQKFDLISMLAHSSSSKSRFSAFGPEMQA